MSSEENQGRLTAKNKRATQAKVMMPLLGQMNDIIRFSIGQRELDASTADARAAKVERKSTPKNAYPAD